MFLYFNKSVLQGKSMVRACLNYTLEKEVFEGSTLNLGAGGKDYYPNLVYKGTYQIFDNKTHDKKIDFECDTLPYKDEEFDNVMLFNVLEHIYNYRHLLSETHRISKTLYGFVPFLMWFHPDPNDYFRYTHQALEKLLTEAGYTDIKIKTLAIGPFTSGFQMIHTTMPRFIRPLFFSLCYGMDSIFKVLGKDYERYALGYYFVCKK